MTDPFKMAIDHVNLLEYFLTYTKKPYLQNFEGHNFYHFEPDKPQAKAIGSLFIEFINLDFKNKSSVQDFIFKYLFIPLLLKHTSFTPPKTIFYTLKNIPETPELKLFTIILSEEEIDEYYEIIYKKYLKDLQKLQKEYIKDLKHIESNTLPKLTYSSLSNALSKSIWDIKIRFDIACTFENDDLEKNVPFYYITPNFEEVLIITLRELVTYCKYFRVQTCENCKKYFIPRTAHKTYYCDEIFRNNVTCKQIGSEIKHKRTLENDELLREYRKRYCSLSKEVSCYKNPKLIKIFENYKKEGKIMRKKYIDGKLQADLFKQWIQKSYIRK